MFLGSTSIMIVFRVCFVLCAPFGVIISDDSLLNDLLQFLSSVLSLLYFRKFFSQTVKRSDEDDKGKSRPAQVKHTIQVRRQVT